MPETERSCQTERRMRETLSSIDEPFGAVIVFTLLVVGGRLCNNLEDYNIYISHLRSETESPRFIGPNAACFYVHGSQ